MSLFKLFCYSFMISFFVSSYITDSALAKNLSQRLGVGFIDEFSNSTPLRQVPAVSLKYGISRDFNVLAAFGLHTVDPTATTIGGKIFKNIFLENNLNFYAAGGIAYVKRESSGVEFLGLIGAEFFIPGVDSLGLSFETGAALGNPTGSFVLRTVGFTFLNAGMHFYF